MEHIQKHMDEHKIYFTVRPFVGQTLHLTDVACGALLHTIAPGNPIGPGAPVAPFSPVGPSKPYRTRKWKLTSL